MVKPEVARRQLDAEAAAASSTGTREGETGAGAAAAGVGDIAPGYPGEEDAGPEAESPPRRFHGTVKLNATRIGRDAGRIAEEVVSHLAGLVGSKVEVTLEIEANIPNGAPDRVVRIVTENSRTLGFTSQGFEKE